MIRAATERDAAQIATLWNGMIQDTLWTFTTALKTEAEIAARIVEGPVFLVSGTKNLTGFATYSQFRTGPGYAHTMEHSIVIAPAETGTGLGRALLTALEDSARGAAVHSLIAGISSANPRAIAFHRALGYSECGTLPEVGRKNGTLLDLIFMQKIL